MEIHKPKPVHTWRELASEVGVVVFGIIIALSAEQLLERLESHHKIDRAEEQMRLEMSADDGPEVLQRIALADCVDHSLAEVRASVERADDRAAIIAAIGRIDAAALHAVRTSGGPLSEAEQLKLLEVLENLRRDNLDIVRQAGQATQGLKEQAVVMDRTRMRQTMEEMTQHAAERALLIRVELDQPIQKRAALIN